jgi:hypothetical protein
MMSNATTQQQSVKAGLSSGELLALLPIFFSTLAKILIWPGLFKTLC